MAAIKFFDATTEQMVTETGELLRSTAGYTTGVSYRVMHRLDDGDYLIGIRHKDRGDLLTSIQYVDGGIDVDAVWEMI